MTTASTDEQGRLRSYAHEFAAEVTGNYIDGEWSPSASGHGIDVMDPSTSQSLGTVPASSAEDVDSAVSAAAAAQPRWASLTPAERTKLLLEVARVVEEHIDELTALECIDVGKPIAAVSDVELPDIVSSMRYFAGAARVLTAPAGHDYLQGISSTMRREPLGVVAAITPWNYPLLQAEAKIVPALATGNTVVIKPAETTPFSTARYAELASSMP